jgi:hypothetical protein
VPRWQRPSPPSPKRSNDTSSLATAIRCTRPGPAASWSVSNRAHDDLRGALVRAVRRLTEGLAHEPLPEDRHRRAHAREGRADGARLTVCSHSARDTTANVEPILYTPCALSWSNRTSALHLCGFDEGRAMPNAKMTSLRMMAPRRKLVAHARMSNCDQLSAT